MLDGSDTVAVVALTQTDEILLPGSALSLYEPRCGAMVVDDAAPGDLCLSQAPTGNITIMGSVRLTAEQRRRAERGAPSPTADDRTVLVGMDRPATPEELRAFVAREQARIRFGRGLPPAA